MTENEQMQKIYGNVPNVFEAGRNSLKNDVANALKGRASGEIVALKDVSSVGHEIKYAVKSKNLFVFPYGESTKTRGNVEFAVSEAGRVTANGTATSGAYIYLITRDKPFSLKAGTYTFSVGDMADTQRDVRLRFWVSTNGTEKTEDIYSSKVVTFNSDVVLASALLSVNEGIKADNLIFEPQIEPGAVKTGWTPFISTPEAAKVRVQGANLFDYTQQPYSNIDNTMQLIDNGFEFTTKGTNAYPAVYFRVYDKAFFGTKLAINLKAVLPSCIEFLDFTVKVNGTDQIAGGTTFPFVTQKTVPEYHEGDFLQLQFVAVNPNKEAGAVIRVTDIQVERETPTEVMPYVAPVEYAQGEAIESIHPGMTITTDTEGALVEVEYNRDINKVFEELTNAIISIGGYL
jgi:hypothetical protein